MSVERAGADTWLTRAGAGVVVAATGLLVVAELNILQPRHGLVLLLALGLLLSVRGER
jgi:hypothetical protein